MMVPAAKKLEDLIHLAELCVDLLQQNEEHYAEVSLLPCTPTLLTVVLMVSHHSSMLSTLINKLNFFSFFSETNFFLCSRKSSQRFSFHLLFNRDSIYFSHDGAFPSSSSAANCEFSHQEIEIAVVGVQGTSIRALPMLQMKSSFSVPLCFIDLFRSIFCCLLFNKCCNHVAVTNEPTNFCYSSRFSSRNLLNKLNLFPTNVTLFPSYFTSSPSRTLTTETFVLIEIVANELELEIALMGLT